MRMVSRINPKEYVQGRMELHFKYIVLRGTALGSAGSFRGPGTVFLKDGNLHLVLHHVSSGNEGGLHFWTGKFESAGKVIGPESDYNFFGLDIYGNRWNSIGVSLDGCDHTSTCSVVKGVIDTLSLEHEDANTEYQGVEYFIHKTVFFPKPRYSPESGFELCVDGMEVITSASDDYCGLIMAGVAVNEIMANNILRSFNVISGVVLQVQMAEYFCGGKYWLELRSVNLEVSNSRLPVPVKFEVTGEVDSLAGFLTLLVRFLCKGSGFFYDYWFHLNRAFQGGLEPTGLTIGIYIEGVLSKYYEALGLDSTFAKEASGYLSQVKVLGFPERIENILSSSLVNAGRFKAATALRNLAIAKKITPKLDASWAKLRHKSAHGNLLGSAPDEQQKFVDLTFANLKLFYEILFDLIGFCGSRIDYGTHGFPSTPSPLQAPVDLG